MVDTIKFSEMTDGGDLANNEKVPGLKSGANVLFNNPWTFLPPGTTAQRPTPSAEVNFRLRFNTDDQLYEYYDSVLGMWTQLQESAFTQGPFLIYTADASIPDAQNLGALANGILKQTITSGIATLDIAVNGTDYWAPGDALTRSQAPVIGNDLTNKTYVDALVAGGVVSVQGTANQVLVNGSVGSPVTGVLVLTTPQSIGTTSSPTFAGLTMSGNINLGGVARTINALDPVNPQDYATKFYVDQTSLNGTSVYAASAATLGTVTQSGSGVGATLTNAGTQAVLTLDGVNPPVGTNVLIKNTATGMSAANEGIYTVTNPGSISTNWVLTRAISYDTPVEINNTGLIVVQNGSTLAGSLWYNTATIVTVDTTSFSYSQFGGNFAMKGANSDITSMSGLTGNIGHPTGIVDSTGGNMLTFNYLSTPIGYWQFSNANAVGNVLQLNGLSSGASVLMNFATKGGTFSFNDNSATNAANLKIFNAAGTHYTGLTVATAQATDLNLTLPAADGAANTALITNGSTVLSFTSSAVLTRIKIQTFLASGTYTPTAGMKYCIIECVGGGGAGGSTVNSTAAQACGGGSGGGGSYARIVATAATIGASQTVTIGAGGTSAAAGNNAGNAGSDTSVGTICIGKGGSGGSGSSGGNVGAAGGAGGVAGTGDFTIVGGDGSYGWGASIITVAPVVGPGGSSQWGQGKMITSTSSPAGTTGKGFGSGGGGASSYNAAGQQAGAAGTIGACIITEYLSV